MAHVGDSRVILCRKDEQILLTTDDDPDTLNEQERIRSRGETVTSNSLGVFVVNGRVGITRNLSDF